MRLNIFSIPKENISDLKDKFKKLGLKSIKNHSENGWEINFYFSSEVDKTPISWVKIYKDFFPDETPSNILYFSVYLWERGDKCFALSYGKSHFYLRQFCDHDFGIEVAKRIANEKDIRQKSATLKIVNLILRVENQLITFVLLFLKIIRLYLEIRVNLHLLFF